MINSVHLVYTGVNIMKKLICLLLLSAAYVVSYAQPNVPNGNFESWVSKSYSELADWTTYGNVSSTDDAYSGSKAIRLDNVANIRTKGFIATGTVVPGKISGIPYDEQPLSARFQAKYDLAPGDQAVVTIIFTKAGSPIAFANTTIEGNTADTFRYFSIPINWQVSTNPDSVGVLISSLDLDQNVINGDGYLIVDDFHFASISTRNKPVPNGDFENWTTKHRDALAFWYTTDDYLFDEGGIILDPRLVSKTEKGRAGSLGIQLNNRKLGNDIIPGVMFTGSTFARVDFPAFPVANRWKYLEGYYQYSPSNGDSAYILIGLYKDGNLIGGQRHFITNNTTTYTYFAAEMEYYTTDIPDSAYVMIACSNPDNPRGEASQLIVDDVKFTDHNSGVYDLTVNRLTVYPNPCHDFIRLSGTSQMTGSKYMLVDVLGNPVTEGTIVHDLIIDMTEQVPGVYILHLQGKHVNTSKILIKE